MTALIIHSKITKSRDFISRYQGTKQYNKVVKSNYDNARALNAASHIRPGMLEKQSNKNIAIFILLKGDCHGIVKGTISALVLVYLK